MSPYSYTSQADFKWRSPTELQRSHLPSVWDQCKITTSYRLILTKYQVCTGLPKSENTVPLTQLLCQQSTFKFPRTGSKEDLRSHNFSIRNIASHHAFRRQLGPPDRPSCQASASGTDHGATLQTLARVWQCFHTTPFKTKLKLDPPVPWLLGHCEPANSPQSLFSYAFALSQKVSFWFHFHPPTQLDRTTCEARLK